MSRIRIIVTIAIAFIIGAIGGAVLIRYNDLLEDFPRVLALRTTLRATCSERNLRPDEVLALLDLYESSVKRQMSWPGRSGYDWKQELIDINLQRYVLYLAANQKALAEQALTRAAAIRADGRKPQAREVDFERELAIRRYAQKGR